MEVNENWSLCYIQIYILAALLLFSRRENQICVCEEEVYISNINNNNKKPTARKMGNDKGKSAPLTSLSFTETQNPLG